MDTAGTAPRSAERSVATERAASTAAPARPASEPRAQVDPRAGSGAPQAVPAAQMRPAGPRRARLMVTRLDPWSVMKTAFLLSVAFGVVTFVAIFMVWSVLGAAGVWDSINAAVASVVEGDNNSSSFDVTDYVGMSRVLGFTLLVAVLDVVLITALATLTAFLYNMAAVLLGGIEVTLAEEER